MVTVMIFLPQNNSEKNKKTQNIPNMMITGILLNMISKSHSFNRFGPPMADHWNASY